jgi:hypothetical protein
MERLVRAALGSVAASLLALVLTSSPVLAMYWGGEVKLSAASAFRAELLRTGSQSAIAIWQTGSTIYARRTANLGFNWGARITLATAVNSWGASSYGARVDLAYVKRVRNTDGSISNRVYYRRSLSGGQDGTWGTRRMTSLNSQIVDVDVARSGSGQVSVVWTGLYTGRIYMATSSDGGATFGTPRYITQTSNYEPGARTVYWSDPRLAIGNGVTYLAYTSARDTLSVRRTLDKGVTWSARRGISSSASPPYSIVAAGSWAVVGYTTAAAGALRAAYRRTFDKGGYWSPSDRYPVYPAAGEVSSDPQFTYHNGVLAVIFRYGPLRTATIWHRTTTNVGTSWSTRTQVSRSHGGSGEQVRPSGVTILDGRHLAGYDQEDAEGVALGYWVRRGAP